MDSTNSTGISMDVQNQTYRRKHKLLKQKYHYLRLNNDKLKNRIYHVKKEIKYLKSLKRVLFQRLMVYKDLFMEQCLEIPDTEPGASIGFEVIDDVVDTVNSIAAQQTRVAAVVQTQSLEYQDDLFSNHGNHHMQMLNQSTSSHNQSASNSTAAQQWPSKKQRQRDWEQWEMSAMGDLKAAAKQQVSSIIDSVITESREACRAASAAKYSSQQPTLQSDYEADQSDIERSLLAEINATIAEDGEPDLPMHPDAEDETFVHEPKIEVKEEESADDI